MLTCVHVFARPLVHVLRADLSAAASSPARPGTARRAPPRPTFASSEASSRVPEAYRRTRFTLRAAAGASAEGVARCLAAFRAKDPHNRGDVTRVEFLSTMRHALRAPMSDAQLRMFARDNVSLAAPPASGKTRGDARVDYYRFLSRCFPAEVEALGLRVANEPTEGMILNSSGNAGRTEAGFSRAETNRNPLNSAAAEPQGGSSSSYAGSDDGWPTRLSPGMDVHGTIAGVRNLGMAHEVLYPTRAVVDSPSSSRANRTFGKRMTDVTTKTFLRGQPKHKIPEEFAHEPPLCLFHGKTAPRSTLDAAPHERAMGYLRTKLRERLTSARSSGTGIRALKRTLLAAFPKPQPSRLDLIAFKRAMVSMNVNLRREQVVALFHYYSDAEGFVPVDAFCHQVVHGESAEEYAGGAPSFFPAEARATAARGSPGRGRQTHREELSGRLPPSPWLSRPPRSAVKIEWGLDDAAGVESDVGDAAPGAVAGVWDDSPERRVVARSDITAMGVLDGTPRRVIPLELRREPPLNIFSHGDEKAARVDAPSRFSPGKARGSTMGQINASASTAMLYLRRFLAQKISSHSGGDGAFLLRKLLTKPSGRDVLTREEFLFALDRLGLNLPEGDTCEAIYEAHANMMGMVDAGAFCRAVVDY